MNSRIFRATLLRTIVLLFVPALSIAQIPDHCYVEGARLVRYYNLESNFRDTPNTHIDYYYDRQGNCRITQRTTTDIYETKAGDTIYYDSQAHRLTRLKDSTFTLELDENGRQITRIASLNPDCPHIKVEESDPRGNWTRGIAFYKDNPEMEFSGALTKLVKRDIEYYGGDTAADASLEAIFTQIDSRTDNSGTEQMQKSLKAGKAYKDFRSGFFGILLFGVLFPFLRVLFVFGLPVMIASAIPAIPNWLLKAGAVLYGLSFLAESFSSMGHSHLMENVISAIVYLGGTWGLYLGLLQKRCPQCHHSNSMVIRTITRKFKQKKYRVHPNGERELIDSSTSTDYDDDHHCHNCGYEWRTTRDL